MWWQTVAHVGVDRPQADERRRTLGLMALGHPGAVARSCELCCRSCELHRDAAARGSLVVGLWRGPTLATCTWHRGIEFTIRMA